MKNFALFALLAAALCASIGCSRPRTELLVASLPNVNPDFSGRPSPVVVKIYELRRAVAFKQADFQGLFDQPLQTLGADILAADELVFVPGEARSVTYLPGPDARFIGIVAGFRQLDRARWRTLRPIYADGKNSIALELSDTSIIVVPEDKAKKWNPEEAVKEPALPATDPPAARTQQANPSLGSQDDTLTSYEQKTQPAPYAPPADQEELEQAGRRSSASSREPTPGMAEPEEKPRTTSAEGENTHANQRNNVRRPVNEPYSVPTMRTNP